MKQEVLDELTALANAWATRNGAIYAILTTLAAAYARDEHNELACRISQIRLDIAAEAEKPSGKEWVV